MDHPVKFGDCMKGRIRSTTAITSALCSSTPGNMSNKAQARYHLPKMITEMRGTDFVSN